MKRIVLVLLLIAVATQLFAQSYFVSARGSDKNDGESERTPFKSIELALAAALENNVQTITVIGTLTKENARLWKQGNKVVFDFNTIYENFGKNNSQEIIITGIPDPTATGRNRAVLSGIGANATVVFIAKDAKIRFENIEISGGEGQKGRGLLIGDDARISLGLGAVVRDNQSLGVAVEGTFIIDGGEVRDNLGGGIAIISGGMMIMNSGTIRNNTSDIGGAGVMIGNDGRFVMTGGIITGNRAEAGGGVWVMSGGKFEQTGGSVSGNIAPIFPDILKK